MLLIALALLSPVQNEGYTHICDSCGAREFVSSSTSFIGFPRFEKRRIEATPLSSALADLGWNCTQHSWLYEHGGGRGPWGRWSGSGRALTLGTRLRDNDLIEFLRGIRPLVTDTEFQFWRGVVLCPRGHFLIPYSREDETFAEWWQAIRPELCELVEPDCGTCPAGEEHP